MNRELGAIILFTIGFPLFLNMFIVSFSNLFCGTNKLDLFAKLYLRSVQAKEGMEVAERIKNNYINDRKQVEWYALLLLLPSMFVTIAALITLFSVFK